MAFLEQVNKFNFNRYKLTRLVYTGWLNYIVDSLNTIFTSATAMKIDTISESTSSAGVTVEGVLLKDTEINANNLKFATGTLTATEIVGTSAGDIGHTSGAILVAAAPTGYCYEFVSATLIYDYDTAAYTGGANDLVIAVGANTVSGVTSTANLLGASGDKVVHISALAAAGNPLTVHTPIYLKGTAFTQPGTAAGVLRYKVSYRIHATGL